MTLREYVDTIINEGYVRIDDSIISQSDLILHLEMIGITFCWSVTIEGEAYLYNQSYFQSYFGTYRGMEGIRKFIENKEKVKNRDNILKDLGI